MRFTSENVMHDIQVALDQRKELDWSNTDRLLLKAQLHIAGLQRQIQSLELQLNTTLTNRKLRTYDGKAQDK
jgi:hypothetical protein